MLVLIIQNERKDNEQSFAKRGGEFKRRETSCQLKWINQHQTFLYLWHFETRLVWLVQKRLEENVGFQFYNSKPSFQKALCAFKTDKINNLSRAD